MKVYDTLTGEKREFIPSGEEVKMYVCGVTPYDDVHVGHAMSYVSFDMIRRYLEYRGYRVKHVQNFTDIDDKIIARAQRVGVSARDLADRYIDAYFADMDRLNVLRANIYPRATEEIDKIIEMIMGLIGKGHAYQAGGDVYFRVLSDPDYGKLSHRTLDSMLAGARVEVGEEKQHPMDFALWKGAKPGEPAWESPWGPGRPGWHIECSAMILHHLGPSIDIHGGGRDLIFPHHENEIAQSECFTGVVPFVRYWLHNGLLQLGEEKMSKSLGNLVTVGEVLDKYSTDALRLFILSSHYRSPLTYTEEGVAATERGLERLRVAGHVPEAMERQGILDAEPYRRRFVEAMDDDFNAPQAVGVLFDLAKEINRQREAGYSIVAAQRTLLELAGVLGLTLEETTGAEELAVQPFIQLLIDTRAELRRAKQWALADQIRQRLGELGVSLEDSPQGTTWRHRRPGA